MNMVNMYDPYFLTHLFYVGLIVKTVMIKTTKQFNN